MLKIKTTYICQNCGSSSPKWVGKCPACSEWNTYVEEVVEKPTGNSSSVEKIIGREEAIPIKLEDIESEGVFRITTNDEELNRVLGGGIVPGSLILLAGEPGIGKSTLLLQIAMCFNDTKCLYVSGEESGEQIQLRARRLGLNKANCYILTEVHTQRILKHLSKLKPELIIVDSIQTLHSQYIESSAGSVSQIRECTNELQRYAKETGTPIILIGHITKEGNIAGPKVLEHIVDTVLQFEGERNYNYRILRAAKNRFGSTSELGIYEMSSSGLREVKNPSELLISERTELLSGITISASMEGLRPMMIETQALVTQAVYGTPQRSSTGFDLRRLHMLLAVLEKRSGFQFGTRDVFLNIAGGVKVDDPAIDLAVVCALLSSYEDVTVPTNYCFAGEVGLSGEIRVVNRVEQRILEAAKLGFDKIFISGSNKGLSQKKYDIELVTVNKVQEVVGKLF